jgi:hypothetical protein
MQTGAKESMDKEVERTLAHVRMYTCGLLLTIFLTRTYTRLNVIYYWHSRQSAGDSNYSIPESERR